MSASSVLQRAAPANGEADQIADQIGRLSGRYARLMGHASTAALLAGLSRDHHLKSIPRGGTRR